MGTNTFWGGAMSNAETENTTAMRFCESLGKAARKKPVEFLTMLTGVIALIVGSASVVFLGWQLLEVNEALESQAYSYIDNNLIEFDKVLIEHSKYRQYFNNDEALPNGDDEKSKEDAKKILAVADLKLDVIDAFYSQAGHINWNARYTREAWDEYYQDSFRRSRVLCKLICDEWNEYGKEIHQIATGPKACGDTLKLSRDDKSNIFCKWTPRPEGQKK